MTTYNIAYYQCVVHAHRAEAASVLNLYDEDGKRRGTLSFYPDGTYLSGASEDKSEGIVFLKLPVSRFAFTVDVLRNESPIYLTYESPEIAYLSTGEREPVGAGDAS